MLKNILTKETHKEVIPIKEIRLAYNRHEICTRIDSYQSIFRLYPGYYLHAEIYIHNIHYGEFKWNRELTISLKNSKGKLLAQKDVEVEVKIHQSEVIIPITFRPTDIIEQTSYPKEGLYEVGIYDQSNELDCKTLQLVDLPEHYTECFQYGTFELLRRNLGEKNHHSIVSKSQNLFKLDKLESITLAFYAKDLLKKDWPYEFEICLFEETGRLKDRFISEESRIENENGRLMYQQITMGEGEPHYWQLSKYTVEISFMGETVISLPFEVGKRDVESLFNKNTIESPKAINNRKEGKEKKLSQTVEQRSPSELIHKMIGLSTVKKKLHDYKTLMMMDKRRAERGLPVPFRSLHAAFIGNPGTGKSTMVELLGLMFKELGILSKGHVVLENRSTLLGQFYSSENEKTLNALERAKGGILFIDEAHTLHAPQDPKDPGIRVLETLKNILSDTENRDWMLILAGSPKEMDVMLSNSIGLESLIPESNRYYFEDYSVDELMQIADLYCKRNQYTLTPEARKALYTIVKRAHSVKDEAFGNGRYIENLMSLQVIQAMSHRISALSYPTMEQLIRIEKEDIPLSKRGNYRKSIAKLHRMVGLHQLKKNIESHLNFIKMLRIRQEQGLYTEIPPMHMIFVGNPGTGKTTVADFIGEIYKSLGILSQGNVIRVERSDLIGSRVGETEEKTRNILRRGQGNVLFIDEAYTLFEGNSNKTEFGSRALEMLLTPLGKEEIDMLVIMAGYPDKIQQMIDSNTGMNSRFPYTFHFEDYSADELLDIAKSVARKGGYRFSPAAGKALKALIEKEVHNKDAHFGNGRFITRLISTNIIPAMSGRLAKLPIHKLKRKRVLQTICAEDIPISAEELKTLKNNGFDEKAIARALKKLDKLVGLTQVKLAVHNFVEVSRYLHSQGKSYIGSEPLKWSFSGNTGTGKSTVAAILAELLKAMNLLDRGHLVEVKAEEMYNVSDYKIDEILKTAMKRSQQGVLFIDGDAPLFKNPESHFDSEKLRSKLTSFTAEMPGAYALVIAEHESIRQPLVKSLAQCGIIEFDHTFVFEDYTQEELVQILKSFSQIRKMEMIKEAEQTMNLYIGGLCNCRELGYANARTMKLLAHSIISAALLRESRETNIKGLIKQEDVSGFVWNGIRKRGWVGYK